jgi:hypothetical protein
MFVRNRKYYISPMKINRLILFKESIAVYCDKHAKHTLWAECSVFVMLKQVVHIEPKILNMVMWNS